MTLRRCDSLPTHLREGPIPNNNNEQQDTNTKNNNHTKYDIEESLEKEEVVSTWKTLQVDVKNISNNNDTANNKANIKVNSKLSVTKSDPAAVVKRKSIKKRISYQPSIRDKSNSNSCAVQPKPLERGDSSLARRQTLFQRLLSWRTTECDCKEHYTPKLRPEELLCTCGAAAPAVPNQNKCAKLGERGRSKSVGYEVEAAREVAQFRRCASAGATVGTETAATLRARAALTLARRYYPEGGWGWTVTVVGTLVQVITHGLQMGGGPGAIACSAAVRYTVSPLYTHGGENAESYRNRKGYFSINTQVVCDARLMIRHIIARWPGAVHDSTIFNDSPLCAQFERGDFGNYFLLGDSGYPCRHYLLTPVNNPVSPAEERYNQAQISTRNPIERLFGVLKRRFPCLHHGLGVAIERVPAIIVACAVLHNIATSMNEIPLDGDNDNTDSSDFTSATHNTNNFFL